MWDSSLVDLVPPPGFLSMLGPGFCCTCGTGTAGSGTSDSCRSELRPQAHSQSRLSSSDSESAWLSWITGRPFTSTMVLRTLSYVVRGLRFWRFAGPQSDVGWHKSRTFWNIDFIHVATLKRFLCVILSPVAVLMFTELCNICNLHHFVIHTLNMVLTYLTKGTLWCCWYFIDTHTNDNADREDTNHPTNSISPFGILVFSVLYRRIFNPIEKEDELKEMSVVVYTLQNSWCKYWTQIIISSLASLSVFIMSLKYSTLLMCLCQ
jgi:hypothetical protein